MKLEYRNAKSSDIDSISELCSESFDGPFQWHQQIQRLQSVDAFKVQLKDRLNNLVAKGVKHCMIVAIDSEQSEKNSVVGFLEVGLLPSPIGIEPPTPVMNPFESDSNIVPNENVPGEHSGEHSDNALGYNGEPISDKFEGDGTFPQPTMNVDQQTPSTATVTENIKNEQVENVKNEQVGGDEVVSSSGQEVSSITEVSEVVSEVISSDSSPYGEVDPNELVLAAAAIEAEEKRKKKREEVPYLGNVAVSKDCR